MSFTARELALKLSPQPVPGFQLQRICEACDTTAAPPCPAPSFQMQPVCDICDTTGGIPCAAPSLLQMPVCNLCDTTGGAPAPPCPAPSGISPEDYAEAPLAALRAQLRTALSQN